MSGAAQFGAVPSSLSDAGGLFSGMVQKRPVLGNTWALSANPEWSRVWAGLREPLVAGLGLQFCENRVYPKSSSQ